MERFHSTIGLLLGVLLVCMPIFSSGQVLTDVMPRTELPHSIKKKTKKSGTYAIQVPVFAEDNDTIQIATYLIVINSTNNAVFLPTLTKSRINLIADSDCVYEPEFWFDEKYFYTLRLPSKHFVVAMYDAQYNDCTRFNLQWFTYPSFNDMKEALNGEAGE